jgi:membrane-bound metal-dependent hydrolase YbcI (DUF457 family)
MSWVSHDLEPYVLQRHLGRISFVAVLLGSYSPDLLSKWFVYGTGIGGLELKAADPAQVHRGWPGLGFTHSLTFGVAIAALIYLATRSRPWALGFVIGQWAHALTDMGDTDGTMLFFPWTKLFTVGAWSYTTAGGRLADAAAYWSGPGLAWDAVWLVLALASWRMLKRDFFVTRIAPADPFWGWLGRRLPERVLLALYRGSFFYGATRMIGWMLWAHVLHDYPFDLSWGGPHWAADVPSP